MPTAPETFTFESWRQAVRPLLAAGRKADVLLWREHLSTAVADSVSMNAQSTPPIDEANIRLPRSLMALLDRLACFRAEGRWQLMYRLAWRTLFENPKLLNDPADADVSHAMQMNRAVKRDIHKMHAFVRFREIALEGEEPSFFAWFEPQHEILRKAARFFAKRFPNMRWTIATPDGAAIWDLSSLRFVHSGTLAERPRADVKEDLWRTYYRSICNVARINPNAMLREMPQLYWRNLPEAAEIGTLLREGSAGFAARHQQADHEHFTRAKSVRRSLAQIVISPEGVQSCRACEIWQHATQAVEGDGPEGAQLMLVGEQPGDEEDLHGAPFVGPAGKVLDEALRAADLNRSELYLTNAVKHFKWEPRGKRRLHKRPSVAEIKACNGWLQSEISNVKPLVIVALGASALLALTGNACTIEAARAMQLTHAGGARIIATYHPSAILRADEKGRDKLRASLLSDLKRAGSWLEIARETRTLE